MIIIFDKQRNATGTGTGAVSSTGRARRGAAVSPPAAATPAPSGAVTGGAARGSTSGTVALSSLIPAPAEVGAITVAIVDGGHRMRVVGFAAGAETDGGAA